MMGDIRGTNFGGHLPLGECLRADRFAKILEHIVARRDTRARIRMGTYQAG